MHTLHVNRQRVMEDEVITNQPKQPINLSREFEAHLAELIKQRKQEKGWRRTGKPSTPTTPTSNATAYSASTCGDFDDMYTNPNPSKANNILRLNPLFEI